MKKYFLSTSSLVFLATHAAFAQPVPRVETNFSYSYIRYQSDGPTPTFHANGGTFQLGFNFNKWVGLVGDFGGYRGAGLTGYGIDNTLANYVLGPRVSFAKKRTVNPYVQALFGGAWADTSHEDLLATPLVASESVHGSHTAFAMLAGGGVDIRLGKHVAFRPVEADYFFTRLPHSLFSPERLQNNLRLSAGFSFLFGGEKAAPPPPPPPPPAMKHCPDGSMVKPGEPCPKMPLSLSMSGARGQMCQGETMSLAGVLAANHSDVGYQWTVNGQPAGQGASFVFGGANIAPGTYHVAVSAGGASYQAASSETTIGVIERKPPSGSVQADPAQVYAGETSRLSATFAGQCCDPIGSPRFGASEGSVAGNEFDSSGVRFDPAVQSEQRRVVTITASVTDRCNNEGTATTSITVIQKATIAPVRLPDVLFPSGSSRVNNCGKRLLLEQLRSYFERDPGGKAVLVGHIASNEAAAGLAADRARNAAAVITAGSGVCLSIPKDRVLVSSPGVEQNGVEFQPNFCGASVLEQRGSAVSAGDRMAQYRRVEIWFVPSGAELPKSLTAYQAADAVGIGSCPK